MHPQPERSLTNSPLEDGTAGEAAQSAEKAEQPVSGRRQVFASVFTPQWSLGLLLFLCMFLPSYRGCNGEVIVPCQVYACDWTSLEAPLFMWLVTWPYLFGLVLAVGTVCLAWSRRGSAAFGLWWWYSGFILFNAVLWQFTVVAGLASSAYSVSRGDESIELPASGEELFHALIEAVKSPICWILCASGVLAAMIPLTARLCRNWFHAAMWLQCSLVLLAAVYVSTLTPGFLLAEGFLIGGKLSVAFAVLLILVSVAVWADGQRVLVRQKGESPLRLSLRTAMLLMLVGGLGCAWIASVVLSDLALPQGPR